MPSHQWHPSPLVASLFFHWGIWLLVECMYRWLGSYSYQRLSGSIWLWLTFVHLHSSHWPVGYSNTFRCPVYLLFCILVASSLESRSPPLSLQPFSHTYPVQMTFWCPCCRSLWAESISDSLMSSMCRMWLMVTPLLILYQYPLLAMTWFTGLMPMQNSNGGSASPWYIQLLMVTCATALELYKTTTVFYFKVLLSSCWMDWSTLIYMCGTLNHRLSCSKSRQCSG